MNENQATIAVIVSIFAFLISSFTLWKTHLSRAKFVATVSPLKLRIVKVESKSNKKWFLSILQTRVSISNSGAVPGKIYSMRIKVTYPDVLIPKHYECYHWLGTIDLDKFKNAMPKYFVAQRASLIEEDGPFIILSKENKSGEMLFQTKWTEPVIGRIKFELEVYRGKRKGWKSIESWSMTLDEDDWMDLVDNNTVHEASIVNMPYQIGDRWPSDLRKYTGSNSKKLKNQGFGKDTGFQTHGTEEHQHQWLHKS